MLKTGQLLNEMLFVVVAVVVDYLLLLFDVSKIPNFIIYLSFSDKLTVIVLGCCAAAAAASNVAFKSAVVT
jgi:hypothetical protein